MYSVIHPQIQWSEESRQEIESNAYFKWVDAGRPHGQDKHFWDLAEREQIKKRFFPHLDEQLEEIIESNQPEEIIELNYHAPAPKITKVKWGSSYMDSGYFYAPYIPLQ